jgi:hypothetical protein
MLLLEEDKKFSKESCHFPIYQPRSTCAKYCNLTAIQYTERQTDDVNIKRMRKNSTSNLFFLGGGGE